MAEIRYYFLFAMLLLGQLGWSQADQCFPDIVIEKRFPMGQGVYPVVKGQTLMVSSESFIDVYDLQSDKKTTLETDGLSFGEIGTDGEVYVNFGITGGSNIYASEGAWKEGLEGMRVKRIDPKTGKISEMKGYLFIAGEPRKIKATGNSAVVSSEKGAYVTLNRSLGVSAGTDFINGQSFYVNDGKLEIFDRDAKRTAVMNLPPELAGAKYIEATENPDVIAVSGHSQPDQPAVKGLYNTKAKKEVSSQSNLGRYKEVSSNGKYLIFENGVLLAKDMTRIEGVTIPKDSWPRIEGDSLCFSEPGGYRCTDLETKSSAKYDVNELNGNSPSANSYGFETILGPNKIGMMLNHDFIIFSQRSICPKDFVKVDCNCDIQSQSISLPAIEEIKKSLMGIACDRDFDPELWKELTKSTKGPISESEASMWLMRFSKPGGFDSKLHLNLLLGILKSEVPAKMPAETALAVGELVQESPKLSNYIKTNFLLPKWNGEAEPLCLSKSEEKGIASRLHSEIKESLRKTGSSTVTAGFFDTQLPVIKKYLSEAQKDDLADLAGDKLQERAHWDPEYKNIFESKIYYFAKNSIMKKFGSSFKDTVDVTAVRVKELGDNSVRLYRLSLDQCEGCKATDYGFYIKEYPKYEVSSIEDSSKITYKFAQDNEDYQAEIGLKKIPTVRLYDKDTSPKYSELWKDNVLRGLVIVGSNVKGKEGQTTFDQYKYYYQKNGFKFDEPEEAVDTKQLLKSRVDGGESADYFVKEAHAGGDEKNMFVFDQKSKLLRGVRQIGDKKEVVELLYPASRDSKTDFLKNTEFAEWMGQRTKNGGGQLLFVNSSCWSAKKAMYEIPTIADVASPEAAKKLVNIASPTTVYFFRAKDGDIKATMLDGIRTNKTYAEMREKFPADKNYQKGNNQFLFPDDDKYEQAIGSMISDPILIDVKMWRGKGSDMKPYVIDFHQ